MKRPRHLIRDQDRIHGNVLTRRLGAMGTRDKPTAPASPWQNGFAERLIGSVRRECVDHIIVLGELHLRQILQSYARYYNDIRTHRSLDKDAPVSRQIQLSPSAKNAVGQISTEMPVTQFPQSEVQVFNMKMSHETLRFTDERMWKFLTTAKEIFGDRQKGNVAL